MKTVNKYQLLANGISPAFSVNACRSYCFIPNYDDNKAAGLPAKGVVTPIEQDGLRFDEGSFSIIGKPKKAKTYVFRVAAKNDYGNTSIVDFVVNAGINIKDTPVFKQRSFLVSALVNQKYKMNLLELIEPQMGFMLSNQVSFRIVPNPDNPDWLSISNDDTIRLEGRAPLTETRQEVAITLVASSNTGGDSLPFRVHIPIVYDPEKKPVIHPFSLQGIAGTEFYEDLSGHISSPIHDSDLKLILDKVEPKAPWLSVSSENRAVLKGFIPDTAVGQSYQLTLRANTPNGGSSDPVIVSLQINVNPKMAPRFKSGGVLLPMLYPGQPFLYDFVANNDIYPEYSVAPYKIEFTEGFVAPQWLRIEDNKLISEMIPADFNEDIELPIVIKNTPGGTSEQYLLTLYTQY